MKKWFLIFVCLSLLFSCRNQENSGINPAVIDIEYGMDHVTRLKTSDFGKKIRYVPLETTDNGLIGSNPIIKVLKDFIVVESQNKCLLFHKEDGHFIAEIGRPGQGPEEFTGNFSWTDEKEELLLLQRKPNQLLKFDMKGNFVGNIRFSDPPGLASSYLFTDSAIIGYFAERKPANQYVLGIFDKEGILKDTVATLSPLNQIIADGITSISVLRKYENFGHWGASGIILINYKNDHRQLMVPFAQRIWKNGDNIRFKEEFVDTIYTVSGNRLVPAIAFHTGKYHISSQEFSSKINTNDRVFIADISENNDMILFQCIRGMLSDIDSERNGLYTGLFDKQTGEMKIGKNSEPIEDDLSHFMPFTPMGISSSGEFVSLVESWRVKEWLKDHPEALSNQKLSFLTALNEENNPIVVLIE